MKQFLVVTYDGYVGVENLVLTDAQLFSEEQAHRTDLRVWAMHADVGDVMKAPLGRKGESSYTAVRLH